MRKFLTVISVLFLSVWSVSAQKAVTIKNTLPIEEQFNQENCAYTIKKKMDLGGKLLVLPSNSQLIFKRKGAICNGSVLFNHTIIKYSSKKARFSNCSFQGILSNKELHISVIGVYADGEHDDAPLISQVLDCIKNQGTHLFFNCNGDYLLGSEHSKSRPVVYIRSKTTIEFSGKGFMRLGCKSKVGAVLIAGGADDVIIINPLIDGGGKDVIEYDHGEDGLALGGGGKNIRVYGGIIRNCAKGGNETIEGKAIVGDGGKGIQIEPYGLSNCIIDGTKIINCNKAISCYRDLRHPQPIQVVFNNIHAVDCDQFAFIRQVYGFSSKIEEQDVSISNCTIENCGKEDGVFIFGVTRFVRVENCKVVGNVKIPSIFRGRAAKSIFDNITIEQPCESIIDLNPSPYGPYRDEAYQNYYNLNIESQYDYILTSDYNREDLNFNLYYSIINVEASYKPVYDLYKGHGVKPQKFVLNANFRGNEERLNNLTSSTITEQVVWDKRNSKLLLKDESSWFDVEGNKSSYK